VSRRQRACDSRRRVVRGRARCRGVHAPAPFDASRLNRTREKIGASRNSGVSVTDSRAVRLDSPATDAPSPSGDLFAGTPYRVVRPLGSGGTGEVFLVEHTTSGKTFAAKLLHAERARNGRLLDRLRREAPALERLRHPHIVAVTDFGTTSE